MNSRSQRFLISAGSLSLGTVISQALGLLIVLLAAMLFGADNFGIYIVFLAHQTILARVIVLAYPMAIPNICVEEVSSAVVGMVAIALGISSLVLAGYALAGSGFTWPLAIGCFARANIKIFEMLNLRRQRFGLLTSMRALPNVMLLILLLLQLHFDLLRMDLFIWAQTISTLTVALGFVAFSVTALMEQHVRLSRIIKFLKRESRFPLMVAPSEICNATAVALPAILIEWLFPNGAALAGQWGLVRRVGLAPLTLIGQAVAKVFHAGLADDVRAGDLSYVSHYRQVRNLLLLAAIPIAVAMFWIGPLAIVWLFGPQWQLAGVFIRIVSVMFAIEFLVSPISVVFYVFHRHTYLLLDQLSYLLISIVSFAVGAWTSEITIAVILFSLLTSVRFLIIYFKIEQIVQNGIPLSMKEPDGLRADAA